MSELIREEMERVLELAHGARLKGGVDKLVHKDEFLSLLGRASEVQREKIERATKFSDQRGV